MRNRTALLASTALIIGAPSLANAQTAQSEAPEAASDDHGVAEIVVTAQKRPENVQDVPMAVTAFSGAELERTGTPNIYELSKSVPSLIVSQVNNNRNTTVAIRGFGTSGTNPGIDPSVGIFIDGVYMPSAGTVLANLQDISTVEVLRGPQGTLYGRNTPVGALNITTRAPSDRLEAAGTVTAGNYGLIRVGGYVGGPLGANVGARLSGWYSDRDGYELNVRDGKRINDNRQFGVRGKLRWDPAEAFALDLVGYYATVEGSCCYSDQINPSGPGGVATPGFLAASAAAGYTFNNFTSGDHRLDVSIRPDNRTTMVGGSATFNWELGGGNSFTSITAYDDFEDDVRELAAISLPQPVAHVPQNLRIKSFSEELRFAGSMSLIDYVLGAYYYNGDSGYSSMTQVLTGANRVFPNGAMVAPGDTNTTNYQQKVESIAGFGQLTFNLTDAFSVTGGLRYSSDHKTAALNNTTLATSSAQFRSMFAALSLPNLARTDEKLTWRAGAQYKLGPGSMIYAVASTGYKDGGFNARGNSALVPITFDPENTTAYEIGIKSTLFDRKLVANIDVYRMTLEGFQDSTLNPVTGSGFLVGNAGNRRVQGIEADFRARPIEQINLTGSLTYTDAIFSSYPRGQCPAMSDPRNAPRVVGPGVCDFTGARPANNPEWQWSLGAEVRDGLGGGWEFYAGGDLAYTGSQYLDTTIDVRSYQPSYTLLNLRAGLERDGGRWRIGVWARNVTDESYYVSALTNALTAFISGGGTAGAGGYQGWYGPPRTYGIDLSYRY